MNSPTNCLIPHAPNPHARPLDDRELEVCRNVAGAREELDDLEQDIQEGLADAQSGIVRAAQALHNIRNRGLFVIAGYPSFDLYCRDRWRSSERGAYRFLEHAKVIANLPPEVAFDNFCQSQISEAAAREVSDLPAAQQVEILVASGPKPSAKAVRQVRAAAGVPPKPTRQSNRPAPRKPVDVRAAVLATILSASDASDDDWERIGLQPQLWLDYTPMEVMAAAMGWSVDTLTHAARLMGQAMKASQCGDRTESERLRIEQDNISLGRPVRLAPIDWYSEQELRGMLECEQEFWATTTVITERAG